jgi:hypothetical protein
MSDIPDPPFIYEGMDNMADEKPRSASVSDSVARAIHAMQSAFDTAKQPGMPLSILSNITREAPLGSLLVAFFLGMVVARRR